MGRDIDSKWLHWLAAYRRNQRGQLSSVHASAHLDDSISLHHPSSATNYFSLLSTREDSSKTARSMITVSPSVAIPRIDSSFTGSQLAEFFGQMHQEACVSDPPSVDTSWGPSLSDNEQLQTHGETPFPLAENETLCHTTTSMFIPENAAPLNGSLSDGIDDLAIIPEFQPSFSTAFTFDGNDACTDDAAEPFIANKPYNGVFNWIEGADASHQTGGGSEPPTPIKRKRDEHSAVHIPSEIVMNKKPKNSGAPASSEVPHSSTATRDQWC